MNVLEDLRLQKLDVLAMIIRVTGSNNPQIRGDNLHKLSYLAYREVITRVSTDNSRII